MEADRKLPQSSSDLSQGLSVDGLAGLRRKKEMTRPIRVQAAENTFFLYHLPYRRHDRRGRFSLDHLSVVDLPRRVVEDHDQVVPPVIAGEPLMMTVPSMCSIIPFKGFRSRRLRCFFRGRFFAISPAP